MDALLYQVHRPKALAVARRLLGDAAEAEDLVQDVFLKLHLGRAKFDGKAAYSTWLYRILVNTGINRLRSRKRRARLQLMPEPAPTPEEASSGAEMMERFSAALGGLSPQHAQVLWLREVRGLSYPAIARLLRVPEGTVKSAISRGRARLQTVLASLPSLPRSGLPCHGRAR